MNSVSSLVPRHRSPYFSNLSPTSKPCTILHKVYNFLENIHTGVASVCVCMRVRTTTWYTQRLTCVWFIYNKHLYSENALLMCAVVTRRRRRKVRTSVEGHSLTQKKTSIKCCGQRSGLRTLAAFFLFFQGISSSRQISLIYTASEKKKCPRSMIFQFKSAINKMMWKSSGFE